MFRRSKERLADLETKVLLLEQALQFERELAKRIDAQQNEKIARLEAELDKIQNRTPATQPLYWSEEAEDFDYAYRTGRIDKEELDSLLTSVGFTNPDVEFAPEDYPRLSLAPTS